MYTENDIIEVLEGVHIGILGVVIKVFTGDSNYYTVVLYNGELLGFDESEIKIS